MKDRKIAEVRNIFFYTAAVFVHRDIYKDFNETVGGKQIIIFSLRQRLKQMTMSFPPCMWGDLVGGNGVRQCKITKPT
jgi:hypothetical protein